MQKRVRERYMVGWLWQTRTIWTIVSYCGSSAGHFHTPHPPFFTFSALIFAWAGERQKSFMTSTPALARLP